MDLFGQRMITTLPHRKQIKFIFQHLMRKQQIKSPVCFIALWLTPRRIQKQSMAVGKHHLFKSQGWNRACYFQLQTVNLEISMCPLGSGRPISESSSRGRVETVEVILEVSCCQNLYAKLISRYLLPVVSRSCLCVRAFKPGFVIVKETITNGLEMQSGEGTFLGQKSLRI